MSYSKEQLKKLSGGGQARTTYKVPTIKFNGNTGILTRFEVGDFKNGKEITDVELVIMRSRRTFTSFEKSPDGGSIRMFTNEHNTWQDHITVFEVRTGKKVKAIANGTIETLRAELPTLRMSNNLYCLYNGEVHKLVVRGKTRQSFIDTQKELAKDGVEFFEKKVKLVPTQENGTGGNIYYFLKFEVVGDSDLEVVGPFMEEIAKTMDKIDEEYKETNKRMSSEAKDLAGGDEEDDDIPVNANDEEAEDEEIKVEDIPF
jgi:hypothetical protein